MTMATPNGANFVNKDATFGSPLAATATLLTQGKPKISNSITPAPEPTQPVYARQLTKRVNRASQAHHTVKNYTIGAMAIGLIPLPLVDMVAVTAIQIKTIHSIAKQYEVPFSQNLAKSLLISLLGGTITLTTTILAKSFPVIGQATGIISAMIIGGATTYAVGKIFIEHFESGGTFLDFDPERMRAHFQELYEEGKQLAT
jgi:uncharacterized protein (DUF697 family)